MILLSNNIRLDYYVCLHGYKRYYIKKKRRIIPIELLFPGKSEKILMIKNCEVYAIYLDQFIISNNHIIELEATSKGELRANRLLFNNMVIRRPIENVKLFLLHDDAFSKILVRLLETATSGVDKVQQLVNQYIFIIHHPKPRKIKSYKARVFGKILEYWIHSILKRLEENSDVKISYQKTLLIDLKALNVVRGSLYIRPDIILSTKEKRILIEVKTELHSRDIEQLYKYCLLYTSPSPRDRG